MTAAPLADRPKSTECSPSPGACRVSFAEQYNSRGAREYTPPDERWGRVHGRPFRSNATRQPSNFGGRIMTRPRGHGGNFTAGSYTPPQERSRCGKCGRVLHSNMLECPANTRMCNAYHRRGHFAAVCRAAMHSRYRTTGNGRRGGFY